jgi:hypothetical protein
MRDTTNNLDFEFKERFYLYAWNAKMLALLALPLPPSPIQQLRAWSLSGFKPEPKLNELYLAAWITLSYV